MASDSNWYRRKMSEDPDYYRKRRLHRMEADPEYLEKEARSALERKHRRLETDPEFRAYLRRKKKAYRLRNRDRLREARRHRLMTDPEFAERERLKSRRREKSRKPRDPIKLKARRILLKAIAAGRLIRPEVCWECDEKPEPDRNGRCMVQAHHASYWRPLEVTWLCSKCHGVAHRTAVTDPSTLVHC